MTPENLIMAGAVALSFMLIRLSNRNADQMRTLAEEQFRRAEAYKEALAVRTFDYAYAAIAGGFEIDPLDTDFVMARNDVGKKFWDYAVPHQAGVYGKMSVSQMADNLMNAVRAQCEQIETTATGENA